MRLGGTERELYIDSIFSLEIEIVACKLPPR